MKTPAILAALLAVAHAAEPLREKTFVAWAQPANLEQSGGGVIGLENQAGQFDSLVFGELTPARWMAGSEMFHRTYRQQDSWPKEDGKTMVQIAVVYRGKEVQLFRNGQEYARHTVNEPAVFEESPVALLGIRHFEASDGGRFHGSIDDARIYDSALTGEEISALRPNEAAELVPLAWWPFTKDASDVQGHFPESRLVGQAKVEAGKLILSGGFLAATPKGGDSRIDDMRRREALREQISQTDKLIASARELRDRLQRDPHRPRWHFVAPEGMAMPFDPNGAIFWRGRYHLFYIYQDARGHCWGHASSRDLLHWRHHPTPLAPEPGDVDRGMFSGNAYLNKDGVPTIMYHGVNAGNCVATAVDDELLVWKKSATNPIVPIPKQGEPDFGKYESWDPHGWLEGDRYYAIFGGKTPTLFRSADMVKWEFRGPFLQADREWTGPDEDISCPDFFRFGDRWMLLCISHKVGARYYLGRWENERFKPEAHARLNWPGGTFFAPESLLDDKGRRIVWAWVLDRRNHDVARASGSAAEMSLPITLTPTADGGVRIAPVEELSRLRVEPALTEQHTVTDGERRLEKIRGDSLELAVEFSGDAREVGLKLRASPNGEEETVLTYDRAARQLRVDFSRSTLDQSVRYPSYIFPPGGPNPPVTRQDAPFELAAGETLRLRVFLDRSMLEVFANERQMMTQRIYPTRSDALSVSVIAKGGAATAKVTAWEMTPTNPW